MLAAIRLKSQQSQRQSPYTIHPTPSIASDRAREDSRAVHLIVDRQVCQMLFVGFAELFHCPDELPPVGPAPTRRDEIQSTCKIEPAHPGKVPACPSVYTGHVLYVYKSATPEPYNRPDELPTVGPGARERESSL